MCYSTRLLDSSACFGPSTRLSKKNIYSHTHKHKWQTIWTVNVQSVQHCCCCCILWKSCCFCWHNFPTTTCLDLFLCPVWGTLCAPWLLANCTIVPWECIKAGIFTAKTKSCIVVSCLFNIYFDKYPNGSEYAVVENVYKTITWFCTTLTYNLCAPKILIISTFDTLFKVVLDKTLKKMRGKKKIS